MNTQSNQAWWVLRIGLGVGPLLAGADKFFNILTNWEMYLNPLAPRLLHIQPTTFMHIAGVVEMVVGVLVLTRATRYAAYVVMAWLIAIALSLVVQGQFFDIAVRDLEIALGAFALARLSEARAKESARVSSTARQSLNRAIA
ncbi:MAG: DoxX family membrane protein [Acidobacteriaceae bacterium]